MSDNTQDSGSSRWSFKGRVPIGKTDAAATITNGINQLGGSISRGVGSLKKNMAINKMGGRDSNVYSKGVRELDKYGYERYNIGDESEIFISKVSDKALFNDGQPILVRATDGNSVGSSDPVASIPVLNNEGPVPDDARKLFANVPAGTTTESEFRAIVGVNNNGHVEPSVDNSFLDRMSRTTVNNTRVAPTVEFEDDGDDDHVIIDSVEAPVDVPAEEPVTEMVEETTVVKKLPDFMNRIKNGPRAVASEMEAPVEEPVAEVVEAPVEESVEEIIETPMEATPVEESVEGIIAAPAEETVVETPMEVPVETPIRTEFFIEAEDEVEELECDSNVEVDDYDWIFDEENMVVEVSEGEAIIEATVETPMEATSVEESVEATVEDIVVETPMEVPVEEVIEAPAEETVVEAPIEAPVVEASLTPFVAEIEGLRSEGNAPSANVATTSEVATPIQQQTAITSSEAIAPKVMAAITDDGEALPPMSDPVTRRTRTVRSQKFVGGVLVDVKKEDDGVNNRVSGSCSVTEIPSVQISDHVRDIMVLTVPRLEMDEQVPLVEPDEAMPDDGMAKRFAKAFIYDDTPRMDVTNEVYDLMCLADPTVGDWDIEGTVEAYTQEILDDGLEMAWFPRTVDVTVQEIEEESIESQTRAEVYEIEVEDVVTALPSPVEMLMLPSGEVMEATTSEIEVVDATVDDLPLVMFSFGPTRDADGGRIVCFSF